MNSKLIVTDNKDNIIEEVITPLNVTVGQTLVSEVKAMINNGKYPKNLIDSEIFFSGKNQTDGEKINNLFIMYKIKLK